MVIVKDLVKVFEGERGEPIRAVDGVSFEVSEGKFFTLLGPSGCGKTTTLRLIAGLERPAAGEIRINGTVVSSAEQRIFVPPNERDIGMVFQSYAIWPHMTVFDNVAFPLTVGKRKCGRKEIEKRVNQALATVQMDGLQDRPAPHLSGGQQQRLALARALVREPKVLLLDEPLSNLDAKLREQMRLELRELQRQLGLTTIYVTHDQAEALAMSNLVAVMSWGKIVQLGKPREIYEQPVNQFTADFIGSTNFVSGKVIGEPLEDGGRLVETRHGNLLCHVPADIQKGEAVLISIRPQNALISRQPTAGAHNVFSGKVRVAAFLGEYVDCQVEVGGDLLRVHMHPRLKIRRGEEVFVHLPRDLCMVVPDENRSDRAIPRATSNG
ncbi:MAG: ABC transporter ATP-binding protein [Anaerolineae bacterium]